TSNANPSMLIMPFVTLTSNVADEKFPVDFNQQFTNFLSNLIAKPAARISLLVTTSARLTHGGSSDSTCLITVKAIGAFNDELNVKYSAKIAEFIHQSLGITPEKCLIEFVNLEPQNVSNSGTTMKVLMSKK
uniref:Macrophage migration inhibitory factor n=1 Tax=Parascaris univalens TaxID=6257 RepID=A0A915ALL2_PARUN